VSKDTVSRVWRRIKGDWEAWNKHDLSTEDIIRVSRIGELLGAFSPAECTNYLRNAGYASI
jgi:hypothetical protein